MPGTTTTTISSEQRLGIYTVVANHLGGLSDVWVEMMRENYAKAEELSEEFVDDVLMLRDIGWRPDDPRESFDLTMPREDLMELLNRLRGEAEILLNESPSERKSREEDEDTNRRIRLGAKACEAKLDELDPRPEAERA